MTDLTGTPPSGTMVSMTNTTTDTASMTPLEIDTKLAENYNAQAKLNARIESLVRTMEQYEAQIERANDPASVLDRVAQRFGEARTKLAELQTERRDLAAQSTPYQMEYSNRPWRRYFLVDNTNGHVHKDMSCHTCFPTTVYGWLVDLADKPVDDMIEEWGETACTVCFPSAPTNPNYHRPSRRDREAQEARQAEKKAKDEVKAEKAIKDLDGKELRVDGYPIKTKVAARNKLSDAFQSLVYYGDHPSDYVGQIRKLVPVLNNAGVDWQGPAERAIKKAIKDSVVPPNNPFRLTPEQIKEGEARTVANAQAARNLLADCITIYGAR